MLKSFLTPVTKRHVERRILRTHPLHLFRIIQDVDAYKSFLPLCIGSKILRRSPDGRSFDGELTVGLPPFFTERYVSRVTVVPEKLTIRTESIESKNFDSLKSRWTLGEVVDNSSLSRQNGVFFCDVDFEVEMTVSDPVVVTVLDQVLEQVAGKQVEAFEKRCHMIPIPQNLIRAISDKQ